MLLSFHFPKISSPAQESLEPFSGVLWREPATQSPRIPICCSIATTMYWLSTKNVVVSFPRFCSLALLLRSPACKYTSFRSSTLLLYFLPPSYMFMCLFEGKCLMDNFLGKNNVLLCWKTCSILLQSENVFCIVFFLFSGIFGACERCVTARSWLFVYLMHVWVLLH